MDFLVDPTHYADMILSRDIDPADAEELAREAKASDPAWRYAPQSWCDAVITALHTPR